MLQVYDTFATTSSGRIMHFDVIITTVDQDRALAAARDWLASIGEADSVVKASSCMFCHSVAEQQALSREIEKKGYAIYKLEGCPA